MIVENAIYVDFKGDAIPNSTTPRIVGAGQMPAGAQGVHAFASREFDTYFAGAVGIRKFTATTQATAVTNALASLCVPGQPVAGSSRSPCRSRFRPATTTGCCTQGAAIGRSSGTMTPSRRTRRSFRCARTRTMTSAAVPPGPSGGSTTRLRSAGPPTAHAQTNSRTRSRIRASPRCRSRRGSRRSLAASARAVLRSRTRSNAFHDDIVQIPLFDGTCKVQAERAGAGGLPMGVRSALAPTPGTTSRRSPASSWTGRTSVATIASNATSRRVLHS